MFAQFTSTSSGGYRNAGARSAGASVVIVKTEALDVLQLIVTCPHTPPAFAPRPRRCLSIHCVPMFRLLSKLSWSAASCLNSCARALTGLLTGAAHESSTVGLDPELVSALLARGL